MIHYLEVRSSRSGTSSALIADVMRHFHARSELGKAIIVCHDPEVTLAAAIKQWSRLSRSIQKRRGLATNPVEILKYTYTIMAMQHVKLAAALPEIQPEAHVYFLKPSQLAATVLPCFTLYLTTPVESSQFKAATAFMAPEALVVDCGAQLAPEVAASLKPRSDLEQAVDKAWAQLASYLAGQGIMAETLLGPSGANNLDDAVDQLLGVDVAFLSQASLFQRTLDLARPLSTTPMAQRNQYEAAIMLAHRVQTFASSGFSSKFLHTYSRDDFTLNDNADIGSQLAEHVREHLSAGRFRLAQALMNMRPAAKTSFATWYEMHVG